MKKIKTPKCKVVFYNKQFLKSATIDLGTAQMYVSVDARLLDEMHTLKRKFSKEFTEWFLKAKQWRKPYKE